MNDEKFAQRHIEFFFRAIAGFEEQEIKYTKIEGKDNEYISIAMDKIERITRAHGKTRERVWNNCYFIFHDPRIDPEKTFQQNIDEIKNIHPYLFIRSYVYFIFVKQSQKNQKLIKDLPDDMPKKSDYKIWHLNSKYEIKKSTSKTNIFDIRLDQKEKIDDYMYLANTESEMERMASANSDVIDCIRAFTGDLNLLEQTSEMLEQVNEFISSNKNARVLLEGPARSGKTIIAASLLAKYKDSKFLLMNHYFYSALIDGFHALSKFSKEEISNLTANNELELLKNNDREIRYYFHQISQNLKYTTETQSERKIKDTKSYLSKNIESLLENIKKIDPDYRKYGTLRSLENLKNRIDNWENNEETKYKNPFQEIKNGIIKLKARLDRINSGDWRDIEDLRKNIDESIAILFEKSTQRFFHHDINRKRTSGCWIMRGKPTSSMMFNEEKGPSLIICDEVQRLGTIPKYQSTYDEFNEVEHIIENSANSFFTGDNFQMLNHKYDKGIIEIENAIQKHNGTLKKFRLPESIGVPPNIGALMKYLTHPHVTSPADLIEKWGEIISYKIKFINHNADEFVKLFDDNLSHKKHFAIPADYSWMYDQKYSLKTERRKKPIIPISDHEKEDFTHKFPFFCNEEIMPNYFLSAYELISREVESLYVSIPDLGRFDKWKNEWFMKHLYVLFTRPTLELVVNFDSPLDFNHMLELMKKLEINGPILNFSHT